MYLDYEQNEDNWLRGIFGCLNFEARIQDVGSVACLQGRLLTFPNVLQHRLEPFQLADPTRDGHRKLVALFLVDPTFRIISTANVLCQRKDWWSDELAAKQALPPVSAEIYQQIIGEVQDFPISLEEAKQLREELMKERTDFVLTTDQKFQEETFSLCEH